MRPPCRFAQFTSLIVFTIGTIGIGAWEQSGVASWYGGIFQGRQTANGEIYDTWAYTCAHKTLPFGTILKVVNLKNNRSVRVRVNDRGPFVDDRIIDLTYAAARDLDMIREGTADVLLIAEESSVPKTRFNIQIGSWSKLENARGHKQRLLEAGLNPTAELGSDGHTRISLLDIAESEVFEFAMRLEEMGYINLFIYQVTAHDGSSG